MLHNRWLRPGTQARHNACHDGMLLAEEVGVNVEHYFQALIVHIQRYFHFRIVNLTITSYDNLFIVTTFCGHQRLSYGSERQDGTGMDPSKNQ
ncbi:MAG: hypothetical protein IEMM0006_0111 [bacterium]|nr:MAG: hypothetical protein IEMM0006_0111 [bacterium]